MTKQKDKANSSAKSNNLRVVRAVLIDSIESFQLFCVNKAKIEHFLRNVNGELKEEATLVEKLVQEYSITFGSLFLENKERTSI